MEPLEEVREKVTENHRVVYSHRSATEVINRHFYQTLIEQVTHEIVEKDGDFSTRVSVQQAELNQYIETIQNVHDPEDCRFKLLGESEHLTDTIVYWPRTLIFQHRLALTSPCAREYPRSKDLSHPNIKKLCLPCL